MHVLFDYNEDDMGIEMALEPVDDIFVATLKDFKKVVADMNKLAQKEASYIFKKLEGSHWMLQEDIHNEDEYECAIFKVVSGEVYAISHDVMSFWKKLKKKFDF